MGKVMTSKARTQIERWHKQQLPDREPMYIGQGFVFLWPSGGYSRDNSQHHLVVWMVKDDQREEFVCACRGFYYDENDECPHISDLRKQIHEGRFPP